MLDETGFYAPSVAHNALPGRPWPGISVFLGHNSTVSKQLRYSLSWNSVCTMVPAVCEQVYYYKQLQTTVNTDCMRKNEML